MSNVVYRLLSLITGGVFIFSGLIKLNDPVGTAIKMEEYFEVFAADDKFFGSLAESFHIFVPYALPIAMIMIVFEITLGLALVIDYKRILSNISLFLLLVFFGFLTFYSAKYDKVTDCGCFGDAIKLEPWESFYKDVILLVFNIAMILLIGLGKSKESDLKSSTDGKGSNEEEAPRKIKPIIMLAGLILSIGLGIWAINFLPFIDFRAYAVGNNIPEMMKPKEKPKYKYIMTKDGKDFEFEEYPKDKSYEFKEMIVLNEEESTPAITDFFIEGKDGDYTQETLKGDRFIIAVTHHEKSNKESFADIIELGQSLERSGIQVMLVAWDDGTGGLEDFRHELQIPFPLYRADGVLIKTMMRANPGMLLLKDGVVKGKWHHNETPSADEVKNARDKN